MKRQTAIPRAYLIGFISKRSFRLRGVDVFSEFPIEGMRYHQVNMMEGYGRDFEEGIRDIMSRLRAPEWQWLRPLMAKMRRRSPRRL